MPHSHHHPAPGGAAQEPGALIHWPHRCDLLVTVLFAGRGPRVRTTIADALGLVPGQQVLDVGCGTQTLAVALAKRVGPSGWAAGVDASPEMIAAAKVKAVRAKIDVHFEVAAAQQLPFADTMFDAVTTSLTIHHVPEC